MLLKLNQAAIQLNCCSKVVRDLIDAGRLPVVKLTQHPRGWRVNPSDLQNFMAGEICQSEGVNNLVSGKSTLQNAHWVSELDELLTPEKKQNRLSQKSYGAFNRRSYLTPVSNKP